MVLVTESMVEPAMVPTVVQQMAMETITLLVIQMLRVMEIPLQLVMVMVMVMVIVMAVEIL